MENPLKLSVVANSLILATGEAEARGLEIQDHAGQLSKSMTQNQYLRTYVHTYVFLQELKECCTVTQCHDGTGVMGRDF